MTDAQMTGLDGQRVAPTTIAFCSQCGTPWSPGSESCVTCGLRLADIGGKEVAGSAAEGGLARPANTTAKNSALILSVATLIAVVVTGALLLLSVGGLDRRLSVVEKSTAGIDTWSLQADLSRVESEVLNLSSSIDYLPSTLQNVGTDYSKEFNSILDDFISIGDTLSTVSDTTQSICNALPGC